MQKKWLAALLALALFAPSEARFSLYLVDENTFETLASAAVTLALDADSPEDPEAASDPTF